MPKFTFKLPGGKKPDVSDTPSSGQVLTYNAAKDEWDAQAPGDTGTDLTTKGDLHGYDTGNTRIPIGTDGQVLTADSAEALGLKWATAGGGFTTVYKTADETINSDNTLSDDADLVFSLDANGIYLIIVMIIFESGATADFKYNWSHPSGCQIDAYNTFINETIFFDWGINTVQGQTPNEGLVNGISVVRNGSTAGNLNFQWAQNTSNAEDTTLKQGGCIAFIKLN